MKAVIFDLGGVLAVEGKGHWEWLGEKLNLPPKKLEDLFLRKYLKKVCEGRLSEKEFWKLFLREVKKENVVSFEEIFSEYCLRCSEIPGTRKLVEDAKEKGLKVALLSNNTDARASFYRKELGLKKLFSGMDFFSCELKVMKPSGKAFLSVCRKLGVKPQECVFVDDNAKNVGAARTLGMTAIKFSDSRQARRDFEELIPKTRAIIFDLGKVVMQPLYLQSHESVLKMGFSEEELDKAWIQALLENGNELEKGLESEMEFFKRFSKNLGNRISAVELKRIMRECFARARENPGMISLVEKLSKNFTVALLSDNTMEWIPHWEKQLGLRKLFGKNRFYSCHLGITKPDERIFRHVARELGVKPGECVFVDDRRENVEGARKVGMKAILFRKNWTSREFEKELRNFV